eukprot:4197592-Pleurochrysis_carterae.AAC.2
MPHRVSYRRKARLGDVRGARGRDDKHALRHERVGAGVAAVGKGACAVELARAGRSRRMRSRVVCCCRERTRARGGALTLLAAAAATQRRVTRVGSDARALADTLSEGAGAEAE